MGEIFFISSNGLDTLAPNGYNLQAGGTAGPVHELTKIAIRKTKQTPENKQKVSSNTKNMWKREGHKDKVVASQRKIFATDQFKTKIRSARKQTWSDPNFKQKMSTIHKKSQNQK